MTSSNPYLVLSSSSSSLSSSSSNDEPSNREREMQTVIDVALGDDSETREVRRNLNHYTL